MSSFTKGNLIVCEKKKAKNVNAEFNYRSLRYLNVWFLTKGARDGMKNGGKTQSLFKQVSVKHKHSVLLGK